MKRKIGSLQVIEKPAQGPSKGTIILLHGFRASADDLAPLAHLSPHYHWIFPHGPIDCAYLPLFMCRAWFPIDLEYLHAMSEEGRYEELESGFSKELEAATKPVTELINELEGPLIIGGFSQGAMLATHVALHDPRIQGLASFSGALVNKENWIHTKRGELSYFLSHGEDDPILPFFLAQELSKFLKEKGFKGGFHPFDGGHEIPDEILKKFQQFLN